MTRCKAWILGVALLAGGCRCEGKILTQLHTYNDGDVRCYYTDASQPWWADRPIQVALQCLVVP